MKDEDLNSAKSRPEHQGREIIYSKMAASLLPINITCNPQRDREGERDRERQTEEGQEGLGHGYGPAMLHRSLVFSALAVVAASARCS